MPLLLSIYRAAYVRSKNNVSRCNTACQQLVKWYNKGIICFQRLYLNFFNFSCEQDSNLMGSDFDNEESGVAGIKRYWAVLYVFKFYNSNDIFFSCTVTVCPSGSSSCDIVSIV